MQQTRSNSYLFGGNAPYVEELYEAYLDNPGSVPDNWRTYFDALQNVPAADGSSAAWQYWQPHRCVRSGSLMHGSSPDGSPPGGGTTGAHRNELWKRLARPRLVWKRRR